MKKISFAVVLLFALLGTAKGQGIEFFKGSFEDVLKKAQTEQKNVFIDFYAVWCGPCKLMVQDVFPDQEVGEYFNRKFVCYQINAEDKAFLAVVNGYKVAAYPTLVIADAKGNVLGQQAGAMDKNQLLKFAKTALGEVLTFQAMYDKLKDNKSDIPTIQALLLEAPDFLARQEGSNRERWSLRIERLYADYRKERALDKMMNPTDFAILMTYHPEAGKGDEVLEHIMKNYDEVLRNVGQEAVYKYVFTLGTGIMEKLSRNGDQDYLKYLDRLKEGGDMRPVFLGLMNFNETDIYTGMKYMYDSEYYLYNKKDVDKYIELKDQYFNMLGNKVNAGDYRYAVNSLYEVLNGKFNPQVSAKCVGWITAALLGDMDPGDRMEMLLMLGDCHKMQKDLENAKKCYKQAYMLSLQFNNPGLSAAVKRYYTELNEE